MINKFNSVRAAMVVVMVVAMEAAIMAVELKSSKLSKKRYNKYSFL